MNNYDQLLGPLRSVLVWCRPQTCLTSSLLAFVLLADAAECQRITLDASTGDYIAVVYDDNGTATEMRVVPANKVVAQHQVVVERTGTTVAYRYRVVIDLASPQGLRTLRVPCPGAAGDFDLLPAPATPTGGAGPWPARHYAFPHGSYCSYLGGAIPLAPGGLLDASLGTTLLPAIGELQLLGSGAGLQGPWPTSDPSELNDPIREFIDSIDGVLAGWKGSVSVVPNRARSLFNEPLNGLAIIRADLSDVCGALGWITLTQVCDDLGSTLDAAAAGVAGSNWRGARDSLGAFLSALSTNHDSGIVTGKAFALLDTNARLVLEGLPNPPTAILPENYESVEGASVTLDGGASSDPEGRPLAYGWSFGDGSSATGSMAAHTYTEDGTYTATLVVTNTDALTDTATTTVTVGNAPPSIATLTGPLAPLPVGSTVTILGDFVDPGVLDTHVAAVDWSDGTATQATVAEGSGSGSLEANHVYSVAGVYSVPVTVTDDDGGTVTETFQYVVVYDPNGAFVTGGGWVESPIGTYSADPTAGGRANFGFVARYQQGAQTPEGETQFRMQASGQTFHSAAYEWLVVAGPKATFQGTGTLDGAPGYGFTLTILDGDEPGGGGVDRFRMKIWELGTGQLLYDSQPGDDDDAVPSTPLGGGQIKIHH